MPKVLVTGGTGLLGRAALQSFRAAKWVTLGTGLSRAGHDESIVKLDLLNADDVANLVHQERPDLIIHSAAERSPDSVAANPGRAHALNVDATARLAALASSLAIPLLYISTDYVFPGVPGEAPYAEDAQPRPTNLYGQLKLDGEKAVLQASSMQNSLTLGAVLRLPVLYGHVDPNVGNKESAVNILVDKVRDCAAGQKVNMDAWAQRFPTNVEDIGEALVTLGAKWLDALKTAKTPMQQPERDFPHIMHFSANERFTKFEMCEIFADILGVDISAMVRDEAGGSGGDGVQRPYDTSLATGELARVIGAPLKTTAFKEWWTRELKA